MGNLGMRTLQPASTKSNPKFVSSEHASSFTGGLDLNQRPEPVSRTRPGTEAGRMRARRATEPVSPHEAMRFETASPEDYAHSNSGHSTVKKTKTHTIRI